MPETIELNPSAENGCYIIHGFTSNVNEIVGLCNFLGQTGLHVKAENLRGHGTSIEDCNRVRMGDWLQQTEQSVAELRADKEKVYLLGTSMGAVLALHLASLFPVEGLIISAPTILFTNPIYANYVNPLTRFIFTSLGKPGKFSDKNQQAAEIGKYEAYPMKAFHQYNKLTKIVIRELPAIKCPVLIQYSKEDQRSPHSNPPFIMARLGAEVKMHKGYDNVGHTMWYDSKAQAEIFADIGKFIAAARI